MRLLTGPAGSGKTAFLLDRFREALRAGNGAVRLLVPTATLAEHIQHRLAREGFVSRPSLVQTLNGFVETVTGDLRQAPAAVVYLIVEQAVRQAARAEFARVAGMPGFCSSLARTIEEFSSAGCDPERLAAHLPRAPLAEAFLAVYREFARELERRGLVLRAARLQQAAARIDAGHGLPRGASVWVDGFHALPDPEIGVIAALARHADVTLALGDDALTDTLRARFAAMGAIETRMPRSRSSPAVALVRAPGIERECEEIARRMLDQASAGRPFREMGVIVRQEERYVPLLRATLERFGIPACFYFDAKLDRHAAVCFLSGAVDAMLGGWEYATTLAVLRLAPRFADFNALDLLDFKLREQLPGAGLSGIRSLLLKDDGQPLAPGAERLLHQLDALRATEEWRGLWLQPRDWTARLNDLRKLFHPAANQPAGVARVQSAALRAFGDALDEAALALDPDREIDLAEFWRAAKSVLRLKPLRPTDSRREVVHVLSAHEARQWVLPVVFICGLVEKEFPKFHRQDAFFAESARARLNQAGIRVRTAAQFEHEERGLFHSAMTRATLLTVLSYPEFDARGDRNLPSLYLEGLAIPAVESRPVRPQPRHIPREPDSVSIQAPALLEFLRTKTVRLTPTSLEGYLQCPFQYFGTRLLRLQTAPPRPENRLDFPAQGNIVHEVLSRWWNGRPDIAALFEEVFARHAAEKRILTRYQTERARNTMLDDLRHFAANDTWPRTGFRSRTEEKFQFELAPGIVVAGKIDRLDETEDGSAFVIDYKYSNRQTTKGKLENENLLQAPFYLMGAERDFHLRPAGMFYVGLKAGVVYAGWGEGAPAEGQPIPPDWFERTTSRALSVLAEIHSGRVAPSPADRDLCRFCNCKDACRVELGAAAAVAEGA
jgi:ATP-dependent helicase/DNAse subunit B